MQEKIITITDIYNRFAFEWSYGRDTIKWQNPAHLLLGDTALYESGDHFANRLTRENLEKRLKAISEAAKKRQPYSVSYEMQVQSTKVSKVKEMGRVFFNEKGEMLLGRGYIESEEVRDQNPNEYFATSDTIQSLNKILQEDDEETEDSALAYLSIDRLPLIGVQHGPDAVFEAMDMLEGKLDKATRDYDEVGRISGTSFGIILRKCGHSEIVSVAKRLTAMVESCEFKYNGKDIPLSASIGGCVIRQGDNATLEAILDHSERALLDAQHIKKISMPKAPAKNTSEPTSRKRRAEDK